MSTHGLVELEAWFPDVEPELPRCPTPVIENRIRDAIIDACERANLWRWEHPEILLHKGKPDYDLMTPTSDTLIHSVLNVRVNGQPVSGGSGVDTHDDYHSGRGFTISDRGQISLSSVPTRDSTPYRSLLPPVVPEKPEPLGASYVMPSTLVDYGMPLRQITLNGPGAFAQPYTFDIIDDDSIPTLPPFDGFIVEFNVEDIDSIIAQSGRSTIVGFRQYGASGSGETLHMNWAYEGSLSKPLLHSSALLVGHIKDALTDGKPFLAIKFRTSFAAQASDFKATFEDFAPYYQMPTVFPLVGSWSRADSGDERTIVFTSLAEYEALSALGLHEHFEASGNTNAWSDTDQEAGLDVHVVARHPTTGATLKYNIDFISGVKVSQTWSKPTSQSLRSATSRYRIDKLATPNGERGLITLIDDINAFDAKFNELPADQFQLANDAPKAADFAQYAIDKAAYDKAVARLNAWVAAEFRTNRGIEALVSIKPSRSTLEVSAVLHRDYYQLVRYGALAKAQMMTNRPWSNPEMGKEMEKQFEYALAKAKQSIDRGFATGSQRLKPRKFA